MTRRARIGCLVALLALASVVGLYSVGRIDRQLAIASSCDAAASGDWSGALARSEGLIGADADGRLAAECRCWALIATDRGGECDALLEDLLGQASDWVPEASLARRVVRARRDAGELESAAALATRAVALHPRDLNLLYLDLSLRSALDGESRVLAASEAALSAGEAALPRRIVLAATHRRRGDAEAALRVLGPEPTGADAESTTAWFDEWTGALADLGRASELREAFVRWESLGGNPVELRARYALRVSTSQISAGVGSVTALLRASLAERAALNDRDLLRSLYERLIAHLVAEHREADALAVYDAALQEVDLPALSREQLLRSASARPPDGVARAGELSFRLPPELAGGTLWLSPPAGVAPDALFEKHGIPDDLRLSVTREGSDWPVRWGVRDAEGRVRASGSVWPVAGTSVAVDVVAGAATSSPVRPAPTRGEADRRPRVFSIVLDCADWRLVNYLRMRGELPFLDDMLTTGHRAVLDSSPPLTAAAMESLVWPERAEHKSFVGLLHQLGLEVGGLASVGRNPVGFLDRVLPETPNFFEVIGAGPHVAANMLFAHGAIEAGRHAEMVGPEGRRRLARRAEGFRVLSSDERERFPGLVTDPRVRSRVETIASEFDVAEALVQEGDVDLLLLRIESLDVLTHALYVELERSGQDDGQATLLEVYRYLDERLARLDAALDADDVLVVMSDHGIRNPMEHDRHALFVARGAGVPTGRAPGTPSLRGVPRVLAGLLGVTTAWDDTGIAPWLVASLEARRSVAVVGPTP